jgi:membrane associated rhomboid family serine protease
MFAQWFLSGQVEQDMGSAGFLILYFSAGIFGNVLGALAFSPSFFLAYSFFALGANFALVGRPSVGASGAIVGTLAVLWVDLLAHWQLEYKPVHKVGTTS